jgi:hypothetical protein
MKYEKDIISLVDLINELRNNGETLKANFATYYGGWRLDYVQRPDMQPTRLAHNCSNRLRCGSKEFIAFLQGIIQGLSDKYE